MDKRKDFGNKPVPGQVVPLRGMTVAGKRPKAPTAPRSTFALQTPERPSNAPPPSLSRK